MSPTEMAAEQEVPDQEVPGVTLVSDPVAEVFRPGLAVEVPGVTLVSDPVAEAFRPGLAVEVPGLEVEVLPLQPFPQHPPIAV